MDVGLNNKNNLGEMAPEFADVVFMIQATDNERFNLWTEWSIQSMSNINPISDVDIEKIKIHDSILYERVKKLNDKVKRFKHLRVKWEQIATGFALTIGHINDLPVCVSFTFAIINGKKVCFYYSTSRVTDHEMIEDWIISKFQLTHDNYSRWNHTNSTNFHNCINSLNSLDKEPRDTVYKK